MVYNKAANMAVPDHDYLDFVFDGKYGLPVRQVISLDDEQEFDPQRWQDGYAGASGRLVNSGEFDGLARDRGAQAIVAALEKRNAGRPRTQFRLHDWGISRQRHWGWPIPIRP